MAALRGVVDEGAADVKVDGQLLLMGGQPFMVLGLLLGGDDDEDEDEVVLIEIKQVGRGGGRGQDLAGRQARG